MSERSSEQPIRYGYSAHAENIAALPAVAKILRDMQCDLREFVDPFSGETARLAIPTKKRQQELHADWMKDCSGSRVTAIRESKSQDGQPLGERHYRTVGVTDYEKFIRGYYQVLQTNWTTAYLGYPTRTIPYTVPNIPEDIANAVSVLTTELQRDKELKNRIILPYPSIQPATWEPDFREIHFMF